MHCDKGKKKKLVFRIKRRQGKKKRWKHCQLLDRVASSKLGIRHLLLDILHQLRQVPLASV